MRDPNRLYIFYQELTNVHMTYFPDWRFGQLIYNFNRWFVSEKKRDTFYIEEDEMIKYIKEYANKYGAKL